MVEEISRAEGGQKSSRAEEMMSMRCENFDHKKYKSILQNEIMSIAGTAAPL